MKSQLATTIDLSNYNDAFAINQILECFHFQHYLVQVLLLVSIFPPSIHVQITHWTVDDFQLHAFQTTFRVWF